MDGIINFSEFFKNIGKKDLPKFDKEEILNDFFIGESDDDEFAKNTEISNFPHVAKEHSDRRNNRIEKSHIEDPDGMYPRDDSKYDEPEYPGGWQDGMGEPPVSESITYSKDQVEEIIQKEIARIKKETISEYSKTNENELNDNYSDFTEEENDEEENDDKIIESLSSDFYKLYADKAETFSCEIELEGANLKDTQIRLVIESDNWNLMFPGEIDRNGKVSIPIKKLNILEEGTRGKIKMEVIAEGTVFTPWEDDFEIKLSKKVMVKFNENKQSKQMIKKPGVKVNFKK
jgi:hypothetical protein